MVILRKPQFLQFIALFFLISDIISYVITLIVRILDFLLTILLITWQSITVPIIMSKAYSYQDLDRGGGGGVGTIYFHCYSLLFFGKPN